MLLGLISGVRDEDDRPELCLVPDKPNDFSLPVPVKSLVGTNFSVHFLSIEEGITVERAGYSTEIIITPVLPAKLYLTPNRPEKPGYAVTKIRVRIVDDFNYKVEFDRGDRGWTEWNPNQKIY